MEHQIADVAHHEVAHREELRATPEETVETIARRLLGTVLDSERDATEWETKFHEAKQVVTENRSRRHEAADAAGIGAEPLGLQAAQAALNEARREVFVLARAADIVEQTRQAIVSRVMPLTMQNMRQVLPLLTDGRYQDAQWDEAASAISIYDARARSYQRKRVFSGGARDQIALALRLAFALAARPGERSLRPGWLFLDEPLSSFDRGRTQALVDLLTRGLIRQEFAQIFLVSHSDSFDPGQFSHRLRLEQGKIVESTLPMTLEENTLAIG